MKIRVWVSSDNFVIYDTIHEPDVYTDSSRHLVIYDDDRTPKAVFNHWAFYEKVQSLDSTLNKEES